MSDIPLHDRLTACFRRYSILCLVANFAVASPTDYFVSPIGSNQNPGTAERPFQTIEKGLSALKPGDALVIRDGQYSGKANALRNFPRGTVENYIHIKAENPGKVILSGGLLLDRDSSYLIFEGLRFHGQETKRILGRNIKFFRNEFKGGPARGNVETVCIGTNDFTPGAEFVLLEDNWVHGSGGRYKILVYNSNAVILRRVLVRFDGFDPGNIAPAADIAIYDSKNIEIQNAISIDGIGGELSRGYVAAFYNVCNRTTLTPNLNISWRGILAINPPGYLMGTEGQCETVNLIVEDAASFGGMYGISQLNAGNAQYNRLTIVGTKGDGVGIFGGTGSVRDSVVRGADGRAFKGVLPTNSVAFANRGGSYGASMLDPMSNGLRYLPRIEVGSTLAKGGARDGQRGAQINRRIGKVGSLFGESGYADISSVELWPFPNEHRIKEEMCMDEGNRRGFCAHNGTITAYIFSLLGNASPYP